MTAIRTSQARTLIWRAFLWILACTIGGGVGLLAVTFLSYLAPFNPYTVSGFAVSQLALGALFGLLVALPQSLLIRNGKVLGWRWTVFTALGFSMALFFANSIEAIVPQLRSTLGYAIEGIAMGIWIGLAQWLAIGHYLDRPVLWPTISGIAWAITLVIGGLIVSLTLLRGGFLYGLLTAYPFSILVDSRTRARTDIDSA